jgi:hypothetical protein
VNITHSPPPALPCLALYTPRAGRMLPAGEGGCAAGSLPPSRHLKLGPAVRCRSPPEFPFRFIWVLGWSTWYLCANDPTPCTCKTNYLRVLMLFSIFLHFRRSFAQPRAPVCVCVCVFKHTPAGAVAGALRSQAGGEGVPPVASAPYTLSGPPPPS